MVSSLRCAKVGLAATVSLSALLGTTYSVQAQALLPTPPNRLIFDAGQPGLGDIERRTRAQVAKRGNRDYAAFPIGSWLLSPSLDAGVLYDDNIYQSRTDKVSSWGTRLMPRFIALRETGIHDTTAYGVGDVRLYPDQSRANTVQGETGVVHRYEIQRDLVWRFQGEYARRSDDEVDYFDTGPFGPQVINRDPRQYNDWFGSTSLQKTWGFFSLGLGGAAQRIIYEATTDDLGHRVSESDSNSTRYRLNARAQYQFTPAFYTFVEPALDWWRYNRSAYDSHGYRVVGGIGSDRISLFRGEVYAGYQQQEFNDPRLDEAAGSAFGGRLFWLPTRDLTVSAVLDQSLSTSVPDNGTVILPDITHTTSASLGVSWSALYNLSATARLGYQFVDYEDQVRQDDIWSASLALTYMVTPRLGLVADYDYTVVDSNLPDNSYDRNRVTIGARAQF
ncbi:outer membrane beta-barrel protein [Microvirga aerophila]|uniref:Outer membrane beta-barrel protein n=1 Tax=Microvirga aerophila TaxID=670291 RepID=A0A512BUW7_9HYPH|nr:outer membrane beta-barrel protein [Microvirga aerophila]GEO15771.1 hypothetical protein MAE02_34670 [Microvirga aerophila]